MTLPISPTELKSLMGSEPTTRVLDVRTGGEFETAHIPGSYNVPLDDLDEHGATIAAIDEPVVLVCQSGGRAARAEVALAGLGMPNLRVLDGGIDAWQRQGGTLRHPAGPARWGLERQVRLVAGGIVAAAIGASVAVPALKWVAGLVGAGLVIAALTNTCAMGMLLAKLPYNRGSSCDVETMVARLRRGGPVSVG
ncbi:MAG: rhodanese-like domain-containing protein [Acidimicrobiales bacterium]